MVMDSIALSFRTLSIDKISAQVDSQLHTLSRDLHTKSAIVADSQSFSTTTNNNHTVGKTVAKVAESKDHLTTEVQLKLLDKIWVIKNLLQELDLSFQQQFAFQYSSISYNVSKLEQKLNDLKHFINKHSSTLSNVTGEPNAATSSESLASSMSALPGAFEDITPDKLQITIPDSELVERVTSNDTASSITIIRAFDSKLDHYKKSFFENLIKLLDTFLIKEKNSLKILKSVQSEINDEQEIETETLSVFEFFEFIDENYSSLVEVNSNSHFRKSFSEQILVFIKVIDQVINKALNIRLNQSPPKIWYQDSNDGYYVLSFENNGLNCISFNSSIQNIIQFLNFFIQLPQFLKYTLKNNPSSHVFKSLSSYVSFNLLLLINTYNNKKINGVNATDFQRRIVTVIKLTYLLINLRILNKNDFYFLNFDSNFFANKLTVRSSNEDFLNFLAKLQETDPTDGNLWTSNISQLNDFFIEKKLNQVINQIKNYLQQFDSFDLVFHELVNRFEINFNTIAATSALPASNATGAKKDGKPFKRKHTHQSSFSNASIMAPISENNSIDSTLDNSNSNSNKSNEKVESLVNNRKSNIFALTGGTQKLNFSNFDSTTTATTVDPAADPVANDKSFNQTALDALTGKSYSDLPNISVNNGETASDLSNGEGLKGPIATVSSPMSPVTPISPFAAAAATNNSIASKLDKKPDDDRIRFSKRFSKQRSMTSLSGDDSSSVNSENSAKLNRRASKRISKRLSKRFSQNDWSWKDEDEEFSFDEDAWGGDEDDDLDLNLSDEEGSNSYNNNNNSAGNSGGGGGDSKDDKIVTNKRNSKSIDSNIDELDDWGWGDDIDDVDLNDTTITSDPKAELENNKNKRNSLFNAASKKQQQQSENKNNSNNNNNNNDGEKNFKKSKSFKTTFIPDEIFKIISEFVDYLTKLNASQHKEYISNEEILSKVLQLIDIYYLIGGYAKYDSKFLFYNDVFYLNMVVKKQLVLQKILDNPTENNGISNNNSEDNFKGPILFDAKVENYLTDVINLEKISFLKIYRKFQNFTNLANLQNTNMVLNQLEFKFKEMFFASFQNLTIDLQQMVVTNFLNEFYQLVINDILQIAMISEQDSNELSKIISFMLNFVNFFGPSHRQVSSLDFNSFSPASEPQQQHQLEKRQKQQELLGQLEIGSQEYDQLVNEINKNDEFVTKYKKNIVNFFKLANFKTIVSSHLASIMENFYNGELYNVETQELIHLIKSLFVDSEIRRRAISDIEEIRNIDV